jgi:predicted HTH domain antitoxin
MQSYEIKMKVPRELPIILHKRLEDVEGDIRRQAAIRYYKQRILSLGKAADLAGLTRIEFIDLLKFCGESVFDYSTEELKEIDLDSDRLEGILNAP